MSGRQYRTLGLPFVFMKKFSAFIQSLNSESFGALSESLLGRGGTTGRPPTLQAAPS